MKLRIAAIISLAMFAAAQCLPVASALPEVVVSGWQVTFDQVNSTYRFIWLLVQHPSAVLQMDIGARDMPALTFMFGVTSATFGLLIAVGLGLFRRTRLCLIFAAAATTSGVITGLQFFELTKGRPFQIEPGGRLWLGSMLGLAAVAAWLAWAEHRSRSDGTLSQCSAE